METEFGLAATDVRGEVGTGDKVSCSISVEQIDDAWSLGPEVSGKGGQLGMRFRQILWNNMMC